MKTIFIIHFNPVELYPPVQNEIGVVSGYTNNKVYVITTRVENNGLDKFLSPSKNISIVHFGKFSMRMGAVMRYISYIQFYSGCLFLLLAKRPKRVLYYETLSSFPVFLYKRFFNKKAEVYIHYHEYTSAEELKTGSKLPRFFHQKEKKLYPFAKWISHTNEERMRKFEKDINPIRLSVKKILPNYPPREWYTSPREKIYRPVKIVYVGALSLESMFTVEFAHWLAKQNGSLLLDIYTYNMDVEAEVFLNKINSPFIVLKSGVNYSALPAILRQYDVGVILYKGYIPNHTFSAPNKLFEYLACGLDVWFPDTIKGSMPYVKTQTYPKVIALDFLRLDEFDFDKAINRNNCNPEQIGYFCEEVLRDLNTQLFK